VKRVEDCQVLAIATGLGRASVLDRTAAVPAASAG
jgi:hypothetical protein